jgi:hypothetical protein
VCLRNDEQGSQRGSAFETGRFPLTEKFCKISNRFKRFHRRFIALRASPELFLLPAAEAALGIAGSGDEQQELLA